MWWTALIVGSGVACALLLPLALKWRLPLDAVIAWALLSGGVLGVASRAILGGVSWRWWLAVQVTAVTLTSAAAVALMFFRDPERSAPGDPRALVSPAEGEVCYVREFGPGTTPPTEKHGRPIELYELGDGPREHGVVIGIAMHLLDVHVNRAPMAGTVRSVDHVPGRFLSLRRPDALARNERTTTIIENGHAKVAVVQIASRLVRRIVSYVDRGAEIAAGQRIGIIKFGSQVDLVLFDLDAEVCVRPGDKVRAGETVLARLTSEARATGETTDCRTHEATAFAGDAV